MNVEHKIKFYPVGNGDNTLIKLYDGTTILTDCQIRSGQEDSNGVKIYDVKSDLLNEVKRNNQGYPYVDLFILTHPHKDHCLGFNDNFYTGNPADYSDTNKTKGEIIIGELWVTQKIFHTDIVSDANEIRKEANRRIRLARCKDSNSSKSGNYLKIIGYNDDDKVEEGLHYRPGECINIFNGLVNDYLEIFLHSPFKKSLAISHADNDENTASIVYQARFKLIKNGEVESRVIIAGDADHYVFDEIVKISEGNNNSNYLRWDLLLAPHHSSWSFYNDTPYRENPKPMDSSKTFLDYGEDGAYIVASSDDIKDNDINPPSFPAKKEYVKAVGANYFYCTGSNGGVNAPKPLIFTIGKGGISRSTTNNSSNLVSAPIPRAGRR